MSYRTWDRTYHTEKYDALTKRLNARRRELKSDEAGGHKRCHDDLEYLQLRYEQQYHRAELYRANATVMAYEQRDRNTKTLGKQYGLASRTIRALKGEIALLRTKAGITELGKTMAEKDMMIEVLQGRVKDLQYKLKEARK